MSNLIKLLKKKCKDPGSRLANFLHTDTPESTVFLKNYKKLYKELLSIASTQ